MQRPMTPQERELMLSICATCFAINEQTDLFTRFATTNDGINLSVEVKHKDTSLYCNWHSPESDTQWVSFTELFPDNAVALTLILNRLLSFLPGTEALVLPLPVAERQAA